VHSLSGATEDAEQLGGTFAVLPNQCGTVVSNPATAPRRGQRFQVLTDRRWTASASEDVRRACSARPMFCLAMSGEGAAVYDGSGWTAFPMPPDERPDPSSLSCASPTFCMVVEYADGTAYVWDGSAWTVAGQFDHSDLPSSLSCASPTFCAAGLSNGQVAMLDGAAWSTWTVFSDGKISVSCTSPTFCAAVNVDGFESAFDGTEWSTPRLIDPHHRSSLVSCASPNFCAAMDVEGYVAVTRDP
jgi:hypothetical protein